mmetsp:Transcript_5869/g.18518  ORF Transcript_5869/g.18518 Transcript_5869/m.18518 type:complete len:250 (+) Transcript_5869:921-1670(+)
MAQMPAASHSRGCNRGSPTGDRGCRRWVPLPPQARPRRKTLLGEGPSCARRGASCAGGLAAGWHTPPLRALRFCTQSWSASPRQTCRTPDGPPQPAGRPCAMQKSPGECPGASSRSPRRRRGPRTSPATLARLVSCPTGPRRRRRAPTAARSGSPGSRGPPRRRTLRWHTALGRRVPPPGTNGGGARRQARGGGSPTSPATPPPWSATAPCQTRRPSPSPDEQNRETPLPQTSSRSQRQRRREDHGSTL